MTEQNASTKTIYDANDAVFNMVEQQIRPWDVLDPVVLDLFTLVPRANFVSEAQQGLAYADVELPIGHGQTMLAPRVEGRILQAVQIQPTDKVLVIGTGSGYLTALAAKLAKTVTTIEIVPQLSALAAQRMKAQGIHNVDFQVGDGVNGYAADAPYDVVIYAGALEMRNKTAENLLKVGGRLFALIGQAPIMEAKLITRISEQDFKEEIVFESCLPLLTNAPKLARFHF